MTHIEMSVLKDNSIKFETAGVVYRYTAQGLQIGKPRASDDLHARFEAMLGRNLRRW